MVRGPMVQLHVVQWKCVRVLVWDATCADTLAPSHRTLAAREPRAVVADAEQRKRVMYAHLNHTHHFIPVAIETLAWPHGYRGTRVFQGSCPP